MASDQLVSLTQYMHLAQLVAGGISLLSRPFNRSQGPWLSLETPWRVPIRWSGTQPERSALPLLQSQQRADEHDSPEIAVHDSSLTSPGNAVHASKYSTQPVERP